MDDFFESVQADSRSKATINNYARREKKFILWLKTDNSSCWDNDADILPCLSRVTTEIMCKYISEQSVHTVSGIMKSFSTPEGIHSMLMNLFARLKYQIPKTFEKEWLQFSKGYRNRIATALRSETFYAHGFLVLGWNLMTRSGTE